MKNRVNQILLAAATITAVLYVYFLLVWVEGIPRPFYDPDDPFRFYELWVYLGVGFHAVPCFCLQLLLCRTAKRPWVRFIPVLLLLAIAAWLVSGYLAATGWDGLGWAVLLLLCIAPTAGYALAWAAYGVQWALQKARAKRRDNY